MPSHPPPALRRLLPAPCLALAAPRVHACQAWFEQQDQRLTFGDGEYEANLPELSPGGLDRLDRLEAHRRAFPAREGLPVAEPTAPASVLLQQSITAPRHR